MNARIRLPILLAMLAAASLCPSGASAQTRAADITIIKDAAAKDAINLGGLSAAGPQGRVFLATLAADLERSGWFKVEKSGATKVTGMVTDAGASVQSACTVTWPAGSFQWARGPGEEDARREAHRFADEIVAKIKGVKGIASTRIAMVRRAGGAAELFVCDADGQNLKQVTHDNALCLGPRWTPDGRAVYLTSYLNGRPCAYRISTETAARQLIANFLGLNAGATVSPRTGADVALILSFPGNPELFLIHLGDGALTRLTRTHNAAEASPCWSPDGSQIAYVSDETSRAQVYIMDVASRKSRRATVTYGTENLSPSWSLDGRQIAYTSRRGGGYQIASLDPARGEPAATLTSGAQHEDPSWAPDNRHLVCARREPNGSVICIIDSLGDPEIPLIKLSGDWITPDWSSR